MGLICRCLYFHFLPPAYREQWRKGLWFFKINAELITYPDIDYYEGRTRQMKRFVV